MGGWGLAAAERPAACLAAAEVGVYSVHARARACVFVCLRARARVRVRMCVPCNALLGARVVRVACGAPLPSQ